METKIYELLLTEIKQMVEYSQNKALLRVNSELLFLYWNIGKTIVAQQEQQGWGTKVVDKLAQDLSAIFPDTKGFSVRNLKNMQRFAKAYPDFEIVQTVSAQLSWS
jgi:predicted nuclease of restriction endonuclease-like (RecB) superfamily